MTDQQEQDRIAVWLATELGWLTTEQMLAHDVADLDPGAGLLARLKQLGTLSPEQCQALEDMVSAMQRHDGRLDVELLEAQYGMTIPPRDGQTVSTSNTTGVQPGHSILTPESPGRYEIRKEIGHGGQARVMLATDRHTGREIAWKELRLDAGSPDSTPSPGRTQSKMVRFLREARITARLEHPNIVPVYELGQRKNGTFYYTMRLVRGETLHKKLRACHDLGARMRLLGPFWDICNAMAFAHKHGVIHRDLKPQNIMVGELGETVLLDWGLAKDRGTDDPRRTDLERQAQQWRELADGKTVSGWAIGTPSYMSPEQALGHVSQMDERSDVWSLGAVLYEILTGWPPFDDADPRAGGTSRLEIMARVSTQSVRPVQERCPDVPPELAAITAKALQRNRADRYPDAKAMAEDVSAYMTGEKVAAHEYTSWELVRRFVSRKKATVVAAGLTLVVILASLIVIGLAYRQESKARLNEVVAHQNERQERLRAHFHLAQAYANRTERLLNERDLLSARIFAAASLASNPSYPGSPVFSPDFETRTPESNWLQLGAAGLHLQASASPVKRLLRTIRSRDVVQQLRFSPDGNLLGASQLSGAVNVWEVRSGQELLRLEPDLQLGCAAMAFSPDSKVLAVGRKGGILELHKIGSPQPLLRLSMSKDDLAVVAYSPDGSAIAAASRRGQLDLLQASTGKLLTHVMLRDYSILSATFSRDGNWLAVAGSDKTIHLLDARKLTVQRVLNGHAEGVPSVNFSPDSRALASASLDRTVRIWDIATGLAKATINLSDPIDSVSFSADGRHLAASGMEGFKIWDATGNLLLLSVAAHGGQVPSVEFSPDGRLFASASYDHTVRIWEHLSDTRVLHLDHGCTVRKLRYSSDGRLIATAGEKVIRIWDSATGKLLRQLAPPTMTHVLSVAFSSDQRWLASSGLGKASLEIWDLQTGTRVHTLPHSSTSWSVAFSPDGKLLASASHDHVARLWDVGSGKKLAELKGHRDRLSGVTFSPDGKMLATTSQDHRVGLWDVTTGSMLAMLEKHTDWVWAPVFSPDGRYLFTAGKDRIAVKWEVATRRPVAIFKGHRQWVNDIGISRDGRLVLTASDDGLVVIWDAATAKPLLHIKGQGTIDSAALSPDGKRIAASSGKGVSVYPLEILPMLDAAKLLADAEVAAGLRLQGYELDPITSP